MKYMMTDERPSLAELVEFCEGDEAAACWLAQQWEKDYPRFLYRNDPSLALQGYLYTERSMEECRQEYKAGRNEALFEAIYWAAREGIPVPDWASKAFMGGWNRYQCVFPDDLDNPSMSTLGGAFGITRPENFNAPAARFQNLCRFKIAHTVSRRVDAGENIGEELFESVAQELRVNPPFLRYVEEFFGVPSKAAKRLLDSRVQKGISATTVKRAYYAAKAVMADFEKWVEKRRGRFNNREPGEPQTEKQKKLSVLRRWR